MEVKYIFGIIETAKEEFFGNYGVTHEDVHTIPYQDISAVVIDSPYINYTTLPKDQVARYLLTHQQVIEKIMDFYTIIPMRLGTYAFNTGEVKEILSKGYTKFKDIFRKIKNKIEIDVVATWNDLNSTIKEISEAKEIKSLKEKLMSGPEGVSMKDQIKIGSLIKNILDKEIEKLASEIMDVLGRVSIDLKAHDLMDDRMIFNAAFLIDKDRKAEFEKELDELDELYGGKINFRCVGPLPPYSFYTIETKKISFEDVDRARKMLLLGDRATKEEIVKAYRDSARLYHPDKNIGSLDAERQFNEIFKAYKILLEYCDGSACLFNADENNPPSPPFSKGGMGGFVGENEFSRNAIIVKVRD